MFNFLADAAFIAGLGGIATGVYLIWGLAIALIVMGSVLTVLGIGAALLESRKNSVA